MGLAKLLYYIRQDVDESTGHGCLQVTARASRSGYGLPGPVLRAQMPELDSLRGVACLMVLFFHGFGNHYSPDHYSGIVKGFLWATTWGWTGVNLFFVLSGLLITGILLDTKDRPGYYKRFYVRRALRILPAYYAILAVLTLFWVGHVTARPESWGFVGLSVIYLPNLTPLFGIPAFYPVLWTLGVEEHFYLLWPFCVHRLSGKQVFILALGICAGVQGLRVLTFTRGGDVFGHYTWLVADGLAMGAMLAAYLRWFRDRLFLRWMTGAALVVGLLCFIVDRVWGRTLAGGSLHITGINAVYLAVLSGAMLLGSRFGVRSRVLEFFGNISYGLYLVHILAFDVLDSVASRLFPALVAPDLPFALICLRFLMGATGAVLVAWISRWYFEEPFLRWKDKFASINGASLKTESTPVEVARAS